MAKISILDRNFRHSDSAQLASAKALIKSLSSHLYRDCRQLPNLPSNSKIFINVFNETTLLGDTCCIALCIKKVLQQNLTSAELLV